MRKKKPPEIIFREATIADATAVSEVHVRSWRESFTGIVPQAYLDQMSVEKRAAAFEKGFTLEFYKMFVAETRAGVIVGFADFGKRRRDKHGKFEAELYAIYLLRDFQRNGIGGRLFDLVIHSAVARGMNSLSLTALEISPYKSFYEKKGGRLIERKTVSIQGESYNTLVYGWDDLTAFQR